MKNSDVINLHNLVKGNRVSATEIAELAKCEGRVFYKAQAIAKGTARRQQAHAGTEAGNAIHHRQDYLSRLFAGRPRGGGS